MPDKKKKITRKGAKIQALEFELVASTKELARTIRDYLIKRHITLDERED